MPQKMFQVFSLYCRRVFLVAPYRAIPRDYLSDTPLLRAMGFLMSQHGQLGAIPPPFSGRFPLGEHAKWRCDTLRPPPHKKGYLSDTCAIPHENKANGCDTPLCDTISKGYCAFWGVSRTGPLRVFLVRLGPSGSLAYCFLLARPIGLQN